MRRETWKVTMKGTDRVMIIGTDGVAKLGRDSFQHGTRVSFKVCQWDTSSGFRECQLETYLSHGPGRQQAGRRRRQWCTSALRAFGQY